MRKLLSSTLAQVLVQPLALGTVIAGMVIAGVTTAEAMPLSRLESIRTGQTVLVSDLVASECQNSGGPCAPRINHRRHYSGTPHDFPYMPSGFNISGYDAGERQFCGFGSYVACAYAGTYCWRRCN